MKRKDIHLISKHSDLKEEVVKSALQTHIYNDATAWKKFLQLLFITLGTGFSVAGVIFFFAYNWASLHKFAKLGLVEALVLLMGGIILFTKTSKQVKNILLSALSVLVGVLFTVFGQIYQTGANAYDLFLSWILAISLWVIVANYAPLWLIFLTLLNTTLVLFAEQVAFDWSEFLVFTLLFGLNLSSVVVSLGINFYTKKTKVPLWFTNTIALVAVTFATMGLSMAILDKKIDEAIVLMLLIVFAYGGGLWYGYLQKKLFYLSIIPFSIILLSAVFFIRLLDDAGSFLLITLFIIGSVTLLIKGLLSLQKTWRIHHG